MSFAFNEVCLIRAALKPVHSQNAVSGIPFRTSKEKQGRSFGRKAEIKQVRQERQELEAGNGSAGL